MVAAITDRVAAIPDRLRRVTNGRPWIAEIDGLRFLAIAAVVLFHIGGEVSMRSGRIIPIEHRYNYFAYALGNGDRGVRLFFVISGLVLALPFARHFLAAERPVSLRAYYLRRITRLEPPYILSLILFATLFAVYSHGVTTDYLHHALASLFYLHNITYADVSPVNMITWSLEVEVQFYILAPLFMQVFRVRSALLRRTALTLLIFISGPFQTAIGHSARGSISILRYIGYFAAGLLIADIFVTELPKLRERTAWDITGTGAIALLFALPHDAEWAHLLLPAVCGVLCLAAMRGPVLRRCLATPWIAVLGGMCYSIYLMHFLWIAVVFKVSRRLIVPGFDYLANYIIQCAVLIPAVLVVSIAFYLAIERPCMDPRWPARLSQRLSPRREI